MNTELTILMPCLNEAETLASCIKKAKYFLQANHIDGEVLVADNGSTDGSIEIARAEGAKVICVETRGYGSALIGGCRAARGQFVIIGDSDDSYDFLSLMPFVMKLREGYDLVMGNRFAGGIEPGAMPWLHRYIGNPVLSFIGRLFFRSKIKDFHCGLRGYNRESILKLGLHTSGMEYASEMIVMCELNGLRIAEVPTTLRKDGRSTQPHLRSFRDGWRHLKFLFMYAPNWLFLYPGEVLILTGIIGGGLLILRQFTIGEVTFSIHTLLFCAVSLMIGINIILLFIMTKIYARNNHFIPDKEASKWVEKIDEDRIIIAGGVMIFLGVISSIWALVDWKNVGFAALVPEQTMRRVIPAITALEIGIMLVFSGFFIGILRMGKKEMGGE